MTCCWTSGSETFPTHGKAIYYACSCWQLARPATFDILRDRRASLVACALADTALWDAIGKALGVPLWRLWGGYRSELPMILIGGYYGHTDLADEVVEVRELGVAGMKLKVGGANPKVDADRFRTVREVAGGDRALPAPRMIDLQSSILYGWSQERSPALARATMFMLPVAHWMVKVRPAIRQPSAVRVSW